MIAQLSYKEPPTKGHDLIEITSSQRGKKKKQWKEWFPCTNIMNWFHTKWQRQDLFHSFSNYVGEARGVSGTPWMGRLLRSCASWSGSNLIPVVLILAWSLISSSLMKFDLRCAEMQKNPLKARRGMLSGTSSCILQVLRFLYPCRISVHWDFRQWGGKGWGRWETCLWRAGWFDLRPLKHSNRGYSWLWSFIIQLFRLCNSLSAVDC